MVRVDTDVNPLSIHILPYYMSGFWHYYSLINAVSPHAAGATRAARILIQHAQRRVK